MTGTLNALLAATLLFVVGHFALSSLSLRKPLIRRLGESGFRAVYAIAVTAAFVWMLFAFGAAPYLEVWTPPEALRWVPVLVMPVALFLFIAGVTTQSPTAVGGDKVLTEEVHDLSPGVLRITRHPFLWGASLWALAHLAVNGDAAAIVMFGGLLVLSLGGMWHIDRRREASMGSAWGTFALTTSLVPFGALFSRRTKFDWAGIGLWRVALVLVAYVALLYFHGTLFGVDVLPA